MREFSHVTVEDVLYSTVAVGSNWIEFESELAGDSWVAELAERLRLLVGDQEILYFSASGDDVAMAGEIAILTGGQLVRASYSTEAAATGPRLSGEFTAIDRDRIERVAIREVSDGGVRVTLTIRGEELEFDLPVGSASDPDLKAYAPYLLGHDARVADFDVSAEL